MAAACIHAVYPVASRTVLADLVAEFKSSGPTYQRTVKATLKASYTNHYRAGMIKLLSVLEFRSNNTTHRPVLCVCEGEPFLFRKETRGMLDTPPTSDEQAATQKAEFSNRVDDSTLSEATQDEKRDFERRVVTDLYPFVRSEMYSLSGRLHGIYGVMLQPYLQISDPRDSNDETE